MTLKATSIKVHQDGGRQTRTHGGEKRQIVKKTKPYLTNRRLSGLLQVQASKLLGVFIPFLSQNCPSLGFASRLPHCDNVDGVFLG